MPLSHGDIVVMEGYFQKNYIHELAKSMQPGTRDPIPGLRRINVTYRWIRNHGDTCPLRQAE